MFPLLARKYIYQYLVVAIVLPVLARLLVMGGLAIERRSGRPNAISKVLKKGGTFAQRRADKSARRKHGRI